MAGVIVKGRAILDERVQVSYGNQDLDLVVRHGLGHGKLIQIKGVIVVNGSSQKVPSVTNLLTIPGGRALNPGQFGEGFNRKVGE